MDEEYLPDTPGAVLRHLVFSGTQTGGASTVKPTLGQTEIMELKRGYHWFAGLANVTLTATPVNLTTALDNNRFATRLVHNSHWGQYIQSDGSAGVAEYWHEFTLPDGSYTIEEINTFLWDTITSYPIHRKPTTIDIAKDRASGKTMVTIPMGPGKNPGSARNALRLHTGLATILGFDYTQGQTYRQISFDYGDDLEIEYSENTSTMFNNAISIHIHTNIIQTPGRYNDWGHLAVVHFAADEQYPVTSVDTTPDFMNMTVDAAETMLTANRFIMILTDQDGNMLDLSTHRISVTLQIVGIPMK